MIQKGLPFFPPTRRDLVSPVCVFCSSVIVNRLLFLSVIPAKHFLVETAGENTKETAGGAVGEDFAAGPVMAEPEPEGEPEDGEIEDNYSEEEEDEFDDGPVSDYEGKRR